METKNLVTAQIIFMLFTLPLISCSHAFGADETYEKMWDHFAILVWQYKTPPPGPEAKKAYQSVNLRGIHLDGGFSDKLLNFAKQNNYNYYVDHAAGKGDLYLYKRDWSKFFPAYRRNRRRPVRPRCLRDPALHRRLKDKIKRNITRAKSGPVLAYAFDDELSTTSFTNPADFCWSQACLKAFRNWLKEQYGNVEALNKEWETDYTSFDEAEPKQVDDLTYYHRLPFNRWNLSRWADHRSFMDSAFADLLKELTEYANSLDPRVPAGFVGGQAPAAYGGYNYWKLCNAVEWMEAYDIGASNEILRSFFGQNKPHVQTYFSNQKPYLDKWFLWYYLVHGDRGVICWPDNGGKPWFNGSNVRDDIKQMADTYKELQGDIGKIFIGAEFLHDEIAVYYSHPSIQASWFMDIEPHRRTWVCRSSSLNNSNATDIINRWAWLKLLEDAGFQYNFVSYQQVVQGELLAKDYKVLIMPRTLALSDKEAEEIRSFVRSGGHVITDYLVGIFDEHCKGRESGALDDLFGVRRNLAKRVLDGKNIAEVNGELYSKPLSQKLMYDGALRYNNFVLYERGLSATDGKARRSVMGSSVIVKKRTGNGYATYLNITPIPYLLTRRSPEGKPYISLISELLAEADITPRVKVMVNDVESPTIERLFWRKGDATYLCIVANAMRNAKIDEAGTAKGVLDSGPVKIKLSFRGVVSNLKNERSKRELGRGKEFEDSWAPYEANVYSLENL